MDKLTYVLTGRVKYIQILQFTEENDLISKSPLIDADQYDTTVTKYPQRGARMDKVFIDEQAEA